MNRKPEIDDGIRQAIDQLLARSAEKFQSGDLLGAVEFGIQAWDLIPEPKSSWDYYPQSLSRTFVEDFAKLGDKENVRKWIAILAEMYGDPNHEDHLVLTTEADAMIALGDHDRAYYVVDRIFEIYGDKSFRDKNSPLLKFYMTEKAKRDG